jgi:predicted glutamine amidotransferase
MCIIVAKEKGVTLPSKNTLKTCFEHNSDGSGLMYVKDNKVIIEKGFMTFGDFWHKIKELKREFNSDLTDKAIVMHFRIGTHGENDKATTHPFAISDNSDDLRATYFETDIAMAHNGIISSYNYDKVLSDTQSFVKDYVSIFKELNKEFYKNERVMELIADKANINSNKLCFLDKDENIYWYGNKVVDNGVVYSNTTYKEPKYYQPKYSYSSYMWEYDNYYYGYSNYYKTPTKKVEPLKEIAKDTIKYQVLSTGDYYMTLTDSDFVDKDQTYYIDNKKNLYEKIDGKLSLIGTQTTVYDSNWHEKTIIFD